MTNANLFWAPCANATSSAASPLHWTELRALRHHHPGQRYFLQRPGSTGDLRGAVQLPGLALE